MKNKDLKEAFKSIKTDEITRKRLLKSIYEKHENKYESKGKNTMNYKKISIMAASLLLVTGLFLAKSNFTPTTNENLAGIPSVSPQTPSGSPMIGVEEVIDNTNINLDTLAENISSIELKNHTADTVFTKIEDTTTISSIIEGLKTSTVRTMSDSDYEAIAKSQSEGNSISLNIILKDGNTAIVRLNTDLNNVYFNDNHHSVDSSFTKLILDNLSSIQNLQDINTPAQS